jgi:thymidylate kinase
MLETQKYLPPPSLTLMIDIAPATAVARKSAGRDRFEQDLGMLERVRSSYGRQSAGAGWHAIDGERPIGDVAADVATVVTRALGPR